MAKEKLKPPIYGEQLEFFCCVCGQIKPMEHLGKAVNDKGEKLKACKGCCAEEQKRQYYSSL